MKLDAAIAAARAESLEHGAGSPGTRRRVLASIERSPRRRLHAVVAAVIASMFGASAFAWYARTPHTKPATPAAEVAPAVATHEPAARVGRSATPAVVIEESPPAPAPIVAVPEPVQTPAAKPRPAIEPAAPMSPAAQPAVATAVTSPAEPAVATAVTSPAQPALAVPAHDAALDLYAAAHDLHFQQRDMAAAVAAWDRYLAAAPRGTLAPEARFNRVVALVRLARWDEAAQGLDAIDATFRPTDVARLRDVIRTRRR